MSTAKVEAEIQWLKNTLLPEIFKTDNFKADNNLIGDINGNVRIHSVQVKFIGFEEAFMLTNCYRAILTLEQGNNEPITTTLVVKRTPKVPEKTFEIVRFAELFSNEILGYKIIMPALEKFAQQSMNIPRFYYGDLGKDYGTIVLQDFATHNWRLSKQKTNLSLGHALVALGNLGTFHGIGFALRYKNREQFDRLTKDLQEPRYSRPENYEKLCILVKIAAERIVNATQKYQPHIDEDFLQRYRRLIQEFFLFGSQMVVPVEPLVTLCHGDYLRNNIAFKYEDNNAEEPTDALMFDLQTMRVCSPMLDFTTFLSLSCYATVRYKYFDSIFDEYYTKLTKSFTKHTQETRIPDFLSRKSLLREYCRYLPFSISTANYFLMKLVEPPALTSEEFLTKERTFEEMREDTLTRGGEEVDRELSHQIKELYELVQKYDFDIFKGFDYV